MKILITGGSGFIGSSLIKEIIKYKSFEIINVDSLNYASNQSNLDSIKNNKSYFFKHLDICDKKKLYNVFKKFKPNSIIHLAAESHVDRSIDSPFNFIKSNIIGTFNLLEISKNYYYSLNNKNKKNFRLIHVSTDEVYGNLSNNKLYADENFPFKPNSPYSASKASSDNLVRAWNKTYNLPTIIVNCSNNYGPFQFPEKLIPHTIICALNGKKIPVYGSGKQIRDWIYIEDHVSALIKILKKGIIGETYNVGSNSQMTNIEVIKYICNELELYALDKKSSKINFFSDLINFVKDRPGHDFRYAINSKKIINNLSWSPKINFKKGIKKTVIWYLKNELWWQNIINRGYKLKRMGK